MKKYGILFSMLLSTSMIHSMHEQGKVVNFGNEKLRVINAKPTNSKHQNNMLERKDGCDCIEYPQCHHMTADLDNTILATFKSIKDPLLFAGSVLLVAVWHWYVTSQSLVI